MPQGKAELTIFADLRVIYSKYGNIAEFYFIESSFFWRSHLLLPRNVFCFQIYSVFYYIEIKYVSWFRKCVPCFQNPLRILLHREKYGVDFENTERILQNQETYFYYIEIKIRSGFWKHRPHFSRWKSLKFRFTTYFENIMTYFFLRILD